jgi:hypothetical protein
LCIQDLDNVFASSTPAERRSLRVIAPSTASMPRFMAEYYCPRCPGVVWYKECIADRAPSPQPDDDHCPDKVYHNRGIFPRPRQQQRRSASPQSPSRRTKERTSHDIDQAEQSSTHTSSRGNDQTQGGKKYAGLSKRSEDPKAWDLAKQRERYAARSPAQIRAKIDRDNRTRRERKASQTLEQKQAAREKEKEKRVSSQIPDTLL